MIKFEEKRAYVQRFFQQTGKSYETVVKVCTFGIDSIWKNTILSEIDHPETVLDLACGTGIVSFAIAKRFPNCRVIGVDITESYLQVARGKAEKSQIKNVQFIQEWAEEFSTKQKFDCITSSYLAKYADIPKLIKHTTTMLKPGGLLLFHDFTYPKSRIISSAWEIHFILLQRLGSKFYPEWSEVFYDLPDMVRKTTWVEDLMTAMKENGFFNIRRKILTLQGSTLISGQRSLKL